ncbi:hypothetical protein ACHHYP_15622 [Achlya hypogyna]|uniref:Uncharacterized protein n=1 Tax=Achlya hypogyna TaxID=1202772 RepID=A0A1V9YAL1_ACHHY|nr:hypothetical protein ACHHYP_15622 [Achlya hypogyna]
MADTTVAYGATFAPVTMDGEDIFSAPLANYEQAEAMDLCSDAEDALYLAALSASFDDVVTTSSAQVLYSFL